MLIMETIVARKEWKNAAALMEVKNGMVIVYGKWWNIEIGKNELGTDELKSTARALPEPEVKIEPLPERLTAEVEKRDFWRAPISAELETYCDDVWVKAKQMCPWFRY